MIDARKAVVSLVAGVLCSSAFGTDVGQEAPALHAKEWLNAAPGFSWSQLKGRLILVENWATW